MNMNQIMNMVIRQFMRIFVAKGIASAVDAVSKMGRSRKSKNAYEDTQRTEDQPKKQSAPEMKIDRERTRTIRKF